VRGEERLLLQVWCLDETNWLSEVFYGLATSRIPQKVRLGWKYIDAYKLVTTRMSAIQLRNGKRMVGISIPMHALESGQWWLSIITYCLRRKNEKDWMLKAAPQLPFFVKSINYFRRLACKDGSFCVIRLVLGVKDRSIKKDVGLKMVSTACMANFFAEKGFYLKRSK
jgi:hypothetical protein